MDVDDINILVDLILSHSNRQVQEFLKSKEIKCTGTTDELRKIIKDEFENKNISTEELISLLDQLEEYGNQQVFLFKIPESNLIQLRDKTFVKELLETKGLSDIYNCYKPLLLPKNPEIISIVHDDDWFKIRWGIKKEDYGNPIEEKTVTEDDGKEYLILKYLVSRIRNSTLFQVSLITGEAELLIHRFTDADYEKEKDNYLGEVYTIFGWDPLEKTELYPAITGLQASNEIRARNLGLKTPRDSSIAITSPSKDIGIVDDPDALLTRDNLHTSTGTNGNFYWLPERSDDNLSRELYTRIYSDRFSIYGERLEKEVNYVISRIRYHLQ